MTEIWSSIPWEKLYKKKESWIVIFPKNQISIKIGRETRESSAGMSLSSNASKGIRWINTSRSVRIINRYSDPSGHPRQHPHRNNPRRANPFSPAFIFHDVLCSRNERERELVSSFRWKATVTRFFYCTTAVKDDSSPRFDTPFLPLLFHHPRVHLYLFSRFDSSK